MDRNSAEFAEFKRQYEEKERYKKEHPTEYPWFIYYQFGFHNMTYLTDEEAQEAIKFYRLYRSGDSYVRFGRQPIQLMRRI